MKQLNSATGVYGPFVSVEILNDRFRCDGVDHPFGVLGATVIEDWVEPPPQPAPVPTSVTRRQAVQALILADKIDLVQPVIDSIPDPLQRKLMQAEWDESQEFQRNRSSLIAIGTAIGLTSEGIDNLFRTAVTL